MVLAQLCYSTVQYSMLCRAAKWRCTYGKQLKVPEHDLELAQHSRMSGSSISDHLSSYCILFQQPSSLPSTPLGIEAHSLVRDTAGSPYILGSFCVVGSGDSYLYVCTQVLSELRRVVSSYTHAFLSSNVTPRGHQNDLAAL